MASMLIIEYPDGQRYAVADAVKAKKHHPGAKIVGYEDGSPYKAPKARTRPSRAKAKAKTPKPAPVAKESAPNGN